MQQKIWRSSVNIILELNFLFFFLAFFYSNDFPPVSLILSLALFSFLMYFALSYVIKGRIYLVFVIVSILLSAIAYLFGFTTILSVFLGVCISWRCYEIIIKENFISSYIFLMFSMIYMFTVILIMHVNSSAHLEKVLVLFVAQLFVIICLKVGDTWLLIGDKIIKRKLLFISATLFFPFVLLAIFLFTVGKWLILSLYYIVVTAFAYIGFLFIKPLLFVLNLLKNSSNLIDKLESPPAIDAPPHLSTLGKEETLSALPISWALILFFIVLFALFTYSILFFFQRNDKNSTLFDEGTKLPKIKVKKSADSISKAHNFQRLQEVRRLMYAFELDSRKISRGRAPFETLEEWLKREKIYVPEFYSTYTKLRYGDMDLSNEDIALFKVHLNNVKATLGEK
ncbi:hypothetical protein [Sutcliffiella deserti]|uniref:hypothetical protein n=1 Tax=Sutcliffiella deserti TaxID=2875501 RepID=UPI001CBDFB5A|nr:hypothetical protein [Sutcliffiella deserti]